jgi:putative ABC transport system permease protein
LLLFQSGISFFSVGLLRNFIGVVIAISIIVGFIVVSMAMYTAVLERTREIGILRSLGASSAMIFSLLLTFVGIALTYFAHWSLQRVGHSGLVQETVYGWWPIAGLIAITGAVLGTLAPAFIAVRQEVIAALAYE